MIPSALCDKLQAAEQVVVLTGSGVSAESGVPTFRDAQTGLWAKFSPEELATPYAFERNAELVWQWYQWRRDLVEKAQPNSGHVALVEMQRRWRQFLLVTQNVDGLHQRAGSQDVIEFHGNIMRTRCSVEGTIVADWQQQKQAPPHCPVCDAPLRPDVVWFGEPISEEALCRSFAAAGKCDLFLSIGTSSLVYPAAGLAEAAKDTGACVVEVNPNPTPLSPFADFSLRGSAGVVLPELANQTDNL